MSTNGGFVLCTACDRAFASIVDLGQHSRDKHHKILTQAPTVQAQPPTLQPQVQTQNKPAPISTASVSEKITCEHCTATFTSVNDLKQHKTAYHSWKCMKCPALPPFENGTAWQAHFNAVHAATSQSGETTDAKGKDVATPTTPQKKKKKKKEVATPINKEKINGQNFDANHDTNTETQDAAIQPKSSSSGLPSVQNSAISSPPSEVLTPNVNQDRIALYSSDDKPDWVTSKVESQRASPNSEDRTVSPDERDLLSPGGQTLNLLVEIDPEPHRGRDEATYEIASDIWSPTMTVSSIGVDQREGTPEYDIDVFQSHLLEPLNGSSPQKGQHIIVPPRGPKPGGLGGHALGATVSGNDPRDEPDIQAQNGLDRVTSSNTEERFEGARFDSPASTTFSSRGAGVDTNQGDLSHDPLRAHRSKTGSAEAHFHCRVCFSDPTSTSNLTATHCGHLFCYECIAAEVLRTSRCPVCKNVLALYCLFKLDVAS